MAADPKLLDYLKGQVARGRLVLFTGAGFSRGCVDSSGREIPTSSQLADEIWDLIAPGEPRAGSSLQDVFQVAIVRQKKALRDLLLRRLSVVSDKVPAFLERWLSFPWRSAYTLNVDDVEDAAARAFSLPRPIRRLSALRSDHLRAAEARSGELAYVHLNGLLEDAPDAVTFSTTQYAQRLANQDPWYHRFIAELLSFPFVFVGTTIDESPLWQHLELRKDRGSRELAELRPRSIIVSKDLPRARQLVLQQFNIEWVNASAEDFAHDYLDQLRPEATLGHSLLAAQAHAPSVEAAIPEVATLVAAAKSEPSLFLLGAEPTWDDLSAGRAIARDVDEEIYQSTQLFLDRPANKGDGGLVVITGTAGSGKSTALMRVAARLAADGHRVSWVDRDSDISPALIRRRWKGDKPPTILAIDDADRYGHQVGNVVADVVAGRAADLVLLSARSTKVERTLGAERLASVESREISMPGLTDRDVGRLVDTLDRENRLGKLKGKPRTEQEAAFREKAGRQLLVAMIEATSGQRLEEKVYDEWQELAPEGRQIYGLISLASSFRTPLSRDDVLLASGDASNEWLNALDLLVRRHVVTGPPDGSSLRARHRRIAEVLLQEIAKQGNFFAAIHRRLVFAVATKVTIGMPSSSKPRRLLKNLLNHDYLFRTLGTEDARRVYETVETLLSFDHHYWLQRGSLEVEEGDVRFAENCLGQARSLAKGDPLVETEFAYMQMKKALANPAAPEATGLFQEALETLWDQIESRGHQDDHPCHVLGSQTLAWSRRGRLHADERKRLLTEALRAVEGGIAANRGADSLRQLRDDLKRELLGLTVR